MFNIRHYITLDGHDLMQEWLKRLRDPLAKSHAIRRINRLADGNFGDHKPCRDGVWELRIDQGAGYRIYYAMSSAKLVLLLCGGSKDTQTADIDRAVAYWTDWQTREE